MADLFEQAAAEFKQGQPSNDMFEQAAQEFKQQGAGIDVPSASGNVHLDPEQAARYGRELQATPLDASGFKEQPISETIAHAALKPFTGIAALGQHLLAGKVGDLGFADAEKRLDTQAENSYLYGQNVQAGATSAATGLATGLVPVLSGGAGPVVAGVNAASNRLYGAVYNEENNQTVDEHFIRKALLEGGLEFAFNKLMQTGITSDVAKAAIAKIAPTVGNPIATTAVRTATGGGLGAANQIAQNAIEGHPLGENVGSSAAQMALLENVGGAVHDYFGPKEPAKAAPPAEPTPGAPPAESSQVLSQENLTQPAVIQPETSAQRPGAATEQSAQGATEVPPPQTETPKPETHPELQSALDEITIRDPKATSSEYLKQLQERAASVDPNDSRKLTRLRDEINAAFPGTTRQPLKLKNPEEGFGQAGDESRLGDVIDLPPDILEKYPKLADASVLVISKQNRRKAAYTPSRQSFEVRSDLKGEDLRRSILHEITHYVQHQEAGGKTDMFSKGPARESTIGSEEVKGLRQKLRSQIVERDQLAAELRTETPPGMFADRIKGDKVRQLSREIDETNDRIKQAQKQQQFRNYQNNPTEKEARAIGVSGSPELLRRKVNPPKPVEPVGRQSTNAPRYEPNKGVRMLAARYVETTGRKYAPEMDYAKVNEERGKAIADWFETAKHDPTDPKVKASYDALKKETMDQYRFLQKKGIKFEGYGGENTTEDGVVAPYKNSADLFKDLQENKHLWVFTGGEMSADHPLAEALPNAEGEPLKTYNDVFRAVHDVFGHTKEGVGFGPRGEENAWRSHVRMYSPEAAPAMTAETRGQNSWVNFGPHGETNRANPEETKYAEQKAIIAPDWAMKEGEHVAPKAPVEAAQESGKIARDSIQNIQPPSPPDLKAPAGGENEPPSEPQITADGGSKPHSRMVPQIVERLLTPVISRIQDLAPTVARRVRDMYLAAGQKGAAWKGDVRDGFKAIDEYRKQNPAQAEKIGLALLNQDWKGLKETLPDNLHPALEAYFAARRQALEQQHEAGVSVGDIGDRFPRKVIDVQGLKDSLGSDIGPYDEAVKLRTAAKGSPLTADERAEVFNDVVNGYGPRAPGSFGPAHARARSVMEVKPEQLKFYADPLEGAIEHFDAAAKAIERAKFLGKGDDPTLLEGAIGKVLEPLVGGMKPEQQSELHGLLHTLFLADTKHMSRPVQQVRRAVYATSLAHAWSGINQLTDVAIQAARYSVGSAVGGLKDALHLTPADGRYLLKDMGMDHPGQEFGDAGKLGKITTAGLTGNFFKRIDILTKESGLNTARRFMENAAKNPGGSDFARLKREWEPVYGKEDFATAMDAFRRGDLHNEVARSLAFAHLTQMQPMTMANMPEQYLKMADGRLMYTLHTFQLQQLDMLRRDIARQVRTPGQRASGLQNLGRVIALAGVAGLGKDFVKDFITGQLSLKTMGQRVSDALLNIVGLSRYVASDFSQSPIKATMNLALPPVSAFDDIWKDLHTTGNGKGLESFKLLPVPYLNDLMYYWTPLGAGYHKTEKAAKSEFTQKLTKVRQDAYTARKSGDVSQARTLLKFHNELAKTVPGTRKTPLNWDDLARPAPGTEERKAQISIEKSKVKHGT